MRCTACKGVAALCLAIALVAAATAASGVFLRGNGAIASATTPRGERYDYVTTGVYSLNSVRIVAEGVGWDLVTLFIAAPALLAALRGIARGSLTARLLALGVLAYVFYQYLMYAVGWSFGPLFVPFIVLFASSLVAMVWIVSTIDISTIRGRFTDRFPARTMAAACWLIASILIGMWSPRIIAGYTGDLGKASFMGMPTLTVQALDLGLIVPLAIATGVLVWRRRPWGYLLAPVLAVKGVTMAGAICAMLLSAWNVEGRLEAAPLALFAGTAIAFGLLAWRMLASVKAERPAEATSARAD